MSKVIIYDYEVFMKDTLLGCNIIDENGDSKIYQTWDLEEIKKFYNNHSNDLWVGHNSHGYDDFITDAIIHNENPYIVSKQIVGKTFTGKCRIKLYSVDLMTLGNDTYSLKLTELICGKDIRTTEVSFDLDRELTEEEKQKTEFYNRADLKQTTYNYNMLYDLIRLKFDIIKEFNLDLERSLRLSGTYLAADVLGAKYTPSLQFAKLMPVMYPNLKIKNTKLIDYYMSNSFRSSSQITIEVAGTEITIGGGGAHSSEKKTHCDKLLYADVSGYYNLIAINYNLLPRSLSPSGKEKYIKMYKDQLAMKKTNPIKRQSYKTILLAVIGAMNMEKSPFYDPEAYTLLTMTGQLFIVDLLEKLEGLVKVIQTNTDGVMLEPINWNDKTKIEEIINEWEKRTGFNIKFETLTNLWQRDVNCYMCLDENKNIIYKGDALKNYDIGKEAYSSLKILKCKEPPIIAQGIVNFLIYGRDPEEFVNSVKTDLKLFQYACKKGTFDYTTYDTVNIRTMEHSTEKLQGIDRAFAFNSKEISGMVYQHKNRYGKHSQRKISNLPENVFIYNGDLRDAYQLIGEHIDYNYYVERITKKILDFVE